MKRLIAVALAIILCAGCLIGVKTIIPRIQYNKGMTLMQQGEYDAAREIFISLGDFDDAVSRSDQALFEKAVDFATKGNAEQALPILETLRSDGLTALYREKADERISQIYLKRAEELVERQEYWAAVRLLYRANSSVCLKRAYEIKYNHLYVGRISISKDITDAANCLREDGRREYVYDTGYHPVNVHENGSIIQHGFDSSAVGKLIALDQFERDLVVGLNVDGTASLLMNNNWSIKPDVKHWRDLVSVHAGSNFLVGLTSSGTVVGTGYSTYGAVDVEDWSDIVEVATGEEHTIGLKSDGTVVTTYNSFYSKHYGDVSAWSDIVSVSAFGSSTIGLKADGTVVYAPSSNTREETNPFADWTDIVAISGGYGIKADGTVVTLSGRFKDWSDIVNIFVGNDLVIGVKKDGSLVFELDPYFAGTLRFKNRCRYILDWKIDPVANIELE